MPILYMFIGLPGSGKSTARMKNWPNAVVVSPDDIREELFGDAQIQDDHNKVFGRSHYRMAKALNEGEDVIFDATNVIRRDRHKIIKKYKDIADIVGVVFTTPIETCIARNNARDRVVPEYRIREMHDRYIEPDISEGFKRLIYIDENGNIKE